MKRQEEDATSYKIKILGRGEDLFFQKNNDALICDNVRYDRPGFTGCQFKAKTYEFFYFN